MLALSGDPVEVLKSAAALMAQAARGDVKRRTPALANGLSMEKSAPHCPRRNAMTLVESWAVAGTTQPRNAPSIHVSVRTRIEFALDENVLAMRRGVALMTNQQCAVRPVVHAQWVPASDVGSETRKGTKRI